MTSPTQIHDRRTGERLEIVEVEIPTLDRHDSDDLYGLALEAGLTADAVVLTAASNSLLPDDAYRRLALDLAAQNIPVFGDLHGGALDALLDAGGLKLVKVSEDDLAVDGWETGSEQQAVDAARKIAGCGVETVVVSRGSSPAIVAFGDRVVRVTPPALTEVDHRGAGDSMTAGITAGHMFGLDPLDAVRLGAAVRCRQRDPPRAGQRETRLDPRAGATGRGGGGHMSDTATSNPRPVGTPVDASAETQASPEVESRIVVERNSTVPQGGVRVLVTNDDGFDSPGIFHLAHALAREFDVTVAAPDRDRSGAGTGIGHFDAAAGIPMRRVDIGVERAFALDGPPGLAVMAAALGAFGEPFTVVVSGINAGINTGQSVIHSGTVGAALTARTFGSHGLAVSLEPSDPWHWESAAEIAVAATRWLTARERQPTAINLNVPGVELDLIRGLHGAELDQFGYFRVAIANETGQKLEFEMSADREATAAEGSDTWLLRQRYATITVLGHLVSSEGLLPDDLCEIWKCPDQPA